MKSPAARKIPPLWRLLLAALVAAAPVLIIAYASFAERLAGCDIAFDIEANQAAIIQISVDRGGGFREQDRARLRVAASVGLQHMRFGIGKGAIAQLQIEIGQSAGRFAIAHLRIVPGNGGAAAEIDLRRMKPLGHVADFSISGGTAKMVADGAYPTLLVALPQPFAYRPHLIDMLGFWPRALAIWAICLALVLAVARAAVWFFAQPKDPITGARPADGWLPAALVIVAALISVYPLFFGRSLTAPQINSVALLYTGPPYIPGGSVEAPSFALGSDLGAFAWQWQPWTQIQRQAIDQGQAPLWNRFDYGGLPEIGQGISQIGDPLHIIPLLAHSAAWSWDLQFGLMRVLFALGCFWTVRRLTGAPWVAAAIGASSAFIGFFLFRINHAGYFALCYAPWLFVGWIEIARAKNALRLLAASLLLCLVSLGALNCGAVKDGSATLMIMQVTGLIFFACVPLPPGEKIRRLAIVALFGAAALSIQYPIASAFLSNLAQSRTQSDVALPTTIPLALLGSFFDDFLYYKIALQHLPTLNFALGLCILWALVRVRRLGAQPGFFPILAGMGGSALLIYGVLPQSVIVAIPFIGRIGHIDDTFGIPFIVLGIFLAGFGLAAFIEDIRTRNWRRPFWICATLLIAATAAAILCHAESSALDAADPVMPIILIGMTLCAILLPIFAARFAQAPGKFLIAGTAVVAIVFTLHARQGLQLASGLWRIDHYLVMPGPRPDYFVPSRSMTWLRAQMAQAPARAIGTQGNLFPGYGAALGIELINGPDPLVPRNVSELLTAFDAPMDWGWRIRFDDLAHLHHFDAMLDFFNVRWIVTPPDMNAGVGDFEQRYSADLAVFERPHAWPRAFFTDQIEHYSNDAELVARIKRANGVPFAAIVGAASTQDAVPAGPVVVPAADYHLRPNGTDFSIDVPTPGMIVLAETCVPGVVASIDGQTVPVECVDAIYRGVRIDRPGHFHVSFDYDPPYWRRAPLAAAASLGFFILGCGFAFLTGRRRTSAQGLAPSA